MNELIVSHLSKEFPLSRKQQKFQGSKAKVKVAVDDVSFSLSRGEIYGLLGPNGAGKTTTLRMIATLLEPKEGKIMYEGTNIKDDIDNYRRKIGFLTTELKLDGFFTPDYTFTYMSLLYGVKKEEIEIRKKCLFKKFGIDPFAFVKIKELSTGMKQKVSLAVSLCHNPEIIIFDEPTNGLDIIASRDVENYLIDLKKEQKIVLISTHIFSLIDKLCSRVGIIVNGKLIVDDDLEHFKKDKSLEERFFEVSEGEILDE